MPNWCTTDYEIYFKSKYDMKACKNFIERAISPDNPRNGKGQDFGSSWLGNFFLEAGYPYHYGKGILHETQLYFDTLDGSPDCRGWVSDVDYNENLQTIFMTTESAWGISPDFISIMMDTLGYSIYDDMDISYFAREPGMLYYLASDLQITENGDTVLNGILELPEQYQSKLPRILKNFFFFFKDEEYTGGWQQEDTNIWSIGGAPVNSDFWEEQKTKLNAAGISIDDITATPIEFKSFPNLINENSKE